MCFSKAIHLHTLQTPIEIRRQKRLLCSVWFLKHFQSIWTVRVKLQTMAQAQCILGTFLSYTGRASPARHHTPSQFSALTPATKRQGQDRAASIHGTSTALSMQARPHFLGLVQAHQARPSPFLKKSQAREDQTNKERGSKCSRWRSR